MIIELLIVVVAYLIGSIPSGYLIARYRGISDIRSHGSGNIGATNVARSLGAQYFFIVFFCDCFKAFAFLRFMIFNQASQLFLLVAALAVLIGNAASVFLQFRGGKGVATSFGILLALAPQLVFILFALWVLVLLLTKTAGIASIITLIALPIISWFIPISGLLMSLIVIMSCLGLWLHRDNIKYLLASLLVNI
jgi:glycerol-3-phosphate acyltransferase PlsY